MSNKAESIPTSLKVLGIYQIVGGALGIGMTIWMMDLSSVSALLLLIILIAMALFAYSMFCGVLLLRRPKPGLKHSMINQLLQVVSFSVLGFSFQYAGGIFLSVGMDLTDSLLFKFNAGISSWQIIFSSSNDYLIINLNLVALSLVYVINRLLNKMNENEIVSSLD